MQSKAEPGDHCAAMVGVVIAGGRSRRFGAEKAVAQLGGRPLLLWAAERLARCCSRVAVNARPATGAEGLARAEQLTVLHDLPGDPDGPLAGVKAGLLWARELGATHLAVSPCDVPLAPDDLYPRLLAAAGEGAALAETNEGRQPMCAVWPVSALPAIVAALDGGGHPPIWRMLEDAGAQKVRFEPAGRFANLNTREDLARFEALLAGGFYQR
ncbi:MAG TPA: molybdenum cofactor guanylyltransferase [Steroidobacteraceae bacterium]|nr:molybdenum cofactor guanylyltransferase [Steroidobacteraceae bacterium]